MFGRPLEPETLDSFFLNYAPLRTPRLSRDYTEKPGVGEVSEEAELNGLSHAINGDLEMTLRRTPPPPQSVTDIYTRTPLAPGRFSRLLARNKVRFTRNVGRLRTWVFTSAEFFQGSYSDELAQQEIKAALDRLTQQGGRKVAFLLVHGNAFPAWSLENFLKAAQKSDYHTIVICNGPVEIGHWGDTAFEVVNRKNVGHDFGAYKEAVLGIYQTMEHSNVALDSCVLANDSVFYPDNFLHTFAACTKQDADLAGLTAAYHPTHHVQTYFLRLSSKALESHGMRNFWMTYRPSSIRTKVIKKGEMGLSRVARKEGLAVAAMMRPGAIASALRGLGEFPDTSLYSLLGPRYQASLGVLPSDQIKDLERVAFLDDFNPSHVWGILFCNQFGIPLKKDIWKSIPSLQVISTLEAYSDSQLEDIASLLDAKYGNFKSMRFFDKADFSVGNR